ncbi:BlaI/MecI/CopY family transcriptional regulator [Paenibacillus thailandensis]|uniref:BlaI/MecI/CopY family transcriptional regulator n=1 Tax=Paenibacillus thailandensis TaxID=393250 RepID=A0ABW5R152_9BACL
MKTMASKGHERGLERFFGPLEAKIMTILWNEPDLYIKDVTQRLEKQGKPVSFNTVMTIMNRLVDKGALNKTSAGRASRYSPVESREHFVENRSRELSQELLEDFGPLVVSHMFDALEEVDPKILAELEQKIHSLKRGK